MPTDLYEMNQQNLDAVIRRPPMGITYEVSGNEPLHPDPMVVTRMFEVSLSKCEYGCKLYRDPRSNVLVLAHNSSYGCRK